jgi:hypothetical protein
VTVTEARPARTKALLSFTFFTIVDKP